MRAEDRLRLRMEASSDVLRRWGDLHVYQGVTATVAVTPRETFPPPWHPLSLITHSVD